MRPRGTQAVLAGSSPNQQSGMIHARYVWTDTLLSPSTFNPRDYSDVRRIGWSCSCRGT
ncbi:hypothetical protein PISMIDRAFT_680396 [Pisolithus microcarpus 441]|uniref:Uncharacterized protein n=1 Tax=Pisolithus microcarpus 441 TaxID=765257 RepID=A0A0C9Z017_9AGAM|nr:hypothetical protein PISMIDRAFT_680396 [Pisolithus microcarpus 441]